MPTLLLTPRSTEDAQEVWRACTRLGWKVHRVHGWRVPAVDPVDVAIYAEPLLATHIARTLRLELLEPAVDWLSAYVAVYGKGAARDGFGPSYSSVVGMPVNRQCKHLRVLQSASYGEKDGKEIGWYAIHLADGSLEKWPIIYGEDVRCEIGDYRPVSRSVVAWTDRIQRNGGRNKSVVFMSTWTNPRPSVRIDSIDLVSARTESAPLLLGITAD